MLERSTYHPCFPDTAGLPTNHKWRNLKHSISPDALADVPSQPCHGMQSVKPRAPVNENGIGDLLGCPCIRTTLLEHA